MSDVVFTICGGSDAPRGRRREVVVNGRRVKTVDIHAHCAVPEANALVGRTLELSLGPSLRTEEIDRPVRQALAGRAGSQLGLRFLGAHLADLEKRASPYGAIRLKLAGLHFITGER